MKDCLCCLVNVIFLSSDLDYLLSFRIVYLSFKCSNCFRRVFFVCCFYLKENVFLICVFVLLLKWLVYIIIFVVFLFFFMLY